METRLIEDRKIEGDIEFDGIVIFANDCEITGSLSAGAVDAKGSIYVHNNYHVAKHDIVAGTQTVGWSQTVGGFQKVGEYQKVGWYQKVGEYNNPSMQLLSEKITVKRITFTPSFYHERHFWLAILEPVAGIDKLKELIKDDSNCWDAILAEARNVREELLGYEHYIPAVRQAIELMLGIDE